MATNPGEPRTTASQHQGCRGVKALQNIHQADNHLDNRRHFHRASRFFSRFLNADGGVCLALRRLLRPTFKETLMEHTILLGSLRRCTTAILVAAALLAAASEASATTVLLENF